MENFFNSYTYQWISFILNIIYAFSVTCAILLYIHNKRLEHCSKPDEKCIDCKEACEKKRKADKYANSTYSKTLKTIEKIPIIKQ